MGPVATATTTPSRDLVQKLLEQNARLKQLVRKIVDTQGSTIRELLVSGPRLTMSEYLPRDA